MADTREQGQPQAQRYDILKALVPELRDELVVVNLGFPAQELYMIQDSPRFFYMLGSMGMASSIGLGLSLGTKRPVVAIDGDGAVLMNLGTLASIANYGPDNYTLLIIDNGAYGSTGDQPTATSGKADLAAIARGAGVASVIDVDGADIAEALRRSRGTPGPRVIVARARPGGPALKRIPLAATTIRDRFTAALQQN